jgi:hypothetical protein
MEEGKEGGGEGGEGRDEEETKEVERRPVKEMEGMRRRKGGKSRLVQGNGETRERER